MRSGWRGTTTAAVIAGLLALGGSAPAFAQGGAPSATTKEAARQIYRDAMTKFDKGDYAGAVVLFEQAEAAIPIHQTKFKIAVCRDRLGQTAEAIRWYQTFLDSQPPEKLAESVNEARARLAVLRAKAGPGPAVVAVPAQGVGQVRIAVTPAVSPGALSYAIDGGPPQVAAPAVNLPAGHHRIVVQAQGYGPVAAELDLGAGQVRDVAVKLVPAGPVQGGIGVVVQGPGGAPGGDVVVRQRSNVPAYVLMGVGAAGLIVGTAFGALALKDKSTFNCTTGCAAGAGPTTPNADKDHRDALISDVTLFPGAVLAAAGVVLLAVNLGSPARTASAPAFITPYAGPTGAGAVGGFKF